MGTVHPLHPGGTPAHVDHVVHLYDEDGQYYDKPVEYLLAALRAGHAVIAIVTEEHRRGLVARLAEHGVDIAQVTARGQLELCDAEEAKAAIACGDGASPDRFAELIAGRVGRALGRWPAVAALGEIVDLLAAEGRFGAVIELEQLWNRLMHGQPISLWCAYQLRNFASAEAAVPFQRVCASHGDVLPLPAAADEQDLSRRTIVARMQQQMFALRNEVDERRAVERRMARHHAVTAALAETLTSRDVMQVAVGAACELGEAGNAAGYRIGEDGRSLELLIVRGTLDGTAALTAAIAAGRPQWEDGVVALPLIFERRALGGVVFAPDVARRFAPDERTLLEGLTVQFSQAMERARLYEEEKAARERLAQSERRKDEFLAMLGHELRNPLAPILTAVEVMRLSGDPSHERERAVVERQARHLVRLVDDLLDLSRITHGNLQLHRSAAEVAAVINRACEIAGPLVQQRRHALAVDVEAGLPRLEIDLDRMAQVISNLVCNAAKYTPPGGRIEVSARRCDGAVEIAVTDNGLGIRPDLLPHIFDLFVQGSQTIDRAEGGLGIGLTLARKVTELHGGTIHAASGGHGKGSTFRVRLPADVARARPSRSSRAPTETQRSVRILVVDDNHDSAEMVADALQHLGHTVSVAHDGPGALTEAAAFRPEVVLLDLGLPTMDGFEVARRLRADGVRVHLVAMTGYGQASDREATREAGFDAHLVKPVDLATLERAIAAAPAVN
jgi:signal transduction histidine kinase/CheY-like chemotaxis protein